MLCVDFKKFQKSCLNLVIGCFLDNIHDRDLPTRAWDLARVNISTCVQFCEKKYFQYAGLQVGNKIQKPMDARLQAKTCIGR